MAQVTGSVVRYPARASFLWYIGLIFAGTVILSQPICGTTDEPPIGWLDAAFTSTSAACVTGLAVRSTERDFSITGQLAILVLMQLGGIGIMTVTTFIMVQFGQREGMRARAVIAQTLGTIGPVNLGWILRRVFLLTFACEAVGFVVLTLRNLVDDPLPVAAWRALFHSVAAFCNAGFSLHDDSLVRHQTDLVTNVTLAALIIIGGLGFPVVFDLSRARRFARGERWHHLSLHTKIMLIGTAALIVLGAAGFLVLEWDGVLASSPLADCLLISVFHSITARTAGFNTVEITALTNATLFMTVLLMAIGGGPCSTAGGFKVSTLMLLVLNSWSAFRGRRRLNVAGRTVPRHAVDRATTTIMLFNVVAAFALIVLLILEQSDASHAEATDSFLDMLFEVVSALGTAGLSTGISGELSPVGKIVIMVLMLLGRLGPISVFLALSLSERNDEVLHPDEEPLIG